MAIGVECAAVNAAFDNLVLGVFIPDGGIRNRERSPSGPFAEGEEITLRQEFVDGIIPNEPAQFAVTTQHQAFQTTRWTEVPADSNTVHYTGPCSLTPPIDCDAVVTFSTDDNGITRITATMTATFTARGPAPTTTR